MAGNWEGGCQCGTVRYRINGTPLTLYACHCAECQKQSASAFGLSLWIDSSHLEILSGKPKIWERPADSGDTVVCAFCPDCGSRIYHAPRRDAEKGAHKDAPMTGGSYVSPRISRRSSPAACCAAR